MSKKNKSDASHNRNLVNFLELMGRCSTLGSAYNPGREELQLNNLRQLYTNAQAALQYLADRKVLAKANAFERTEAIKALPKLVTSVINTMKAYGVSKKTIQDAKAIQRRILGLRATKKSKEAEQVMTEQPQDATTPPTDAEPETGATRTNSVSQKSQESMVEHFSHLVLLLPHETKYRPNEPELQLSGLQAHEQHLRILIINSIAAESELEAARIQRDKMLYDEEDGLVARARQVKSYVKAVFGSNSPQYKQISGMSFRMM
ncbi:MAG: hypothetical protein ACK4TA_23400 [Saprospiraceae bacterium]